jgi:hypothetical protein
VCSRKGRPALEAANPHIDPCLDVLLSNIAQSKIQARVDFTAEFAGIARKIATNVSNIDQQLAARRGMLIRFPPGFSAAIGA